MLIRGDVYRLSDDLSDDPRARGHEQRGRRLGVVLQSEDLPLSTVIVAPTSTAATPRSFRPEVEIEGRATCVLLEHLRGIDTARLGARVGHLSRTELAAVEEALELVLGLDLRRRS
ncbi:type II toxin-antitoxin system PemK/MazF family toxin [Kineosphaera limosa]|nr:type II toxin-antitoxin system PemK/MazF family toxin [Kineosphaera limosa]